MGLLVMVLDKRVQIQKMDTIGHQNPNLFLNEKDGLFIHQRKSCVLCL